MIINIPIQINEDSMQKIIERDYEGKVITEIASRIVTTIAHRSTTWGVNREENGMMAIIKDEVDKYLDSYRDLIIETAGKHLADKLARSKRGKELLEEVANEQK